MKTKILIAASLAALVVPAVSFGSGPTGQDRQNGARACRALRASLGEDLFRQALRNGAEPSPQRDGSLRLDVGACRRTRAGSAPARRAAPSRLTRTLRPTTTA